MKTFLVLLLVLLSLIVALPILGRTQLGKEYISHFIFEKHGWKGSFEDISFYWTSSQKFKNLTLTNGDFEVVIQEGEITLSLIDLLQNPFGEIPISLKEITVETEKTSLLEEIFFFLHLTFDLEIKPLIQCEKIELIFHKGVYTYKKTPFMIGQKYHFASEGSVNSKERTLNIDVGPTAAFLQSTFKIKNLPEDFFLPFHIKGPIGKAIVTSEEALEMFLRHFLVRTLFRDRELWS